MPRGTWKPDLTSRRTSPRPRGWKTLRGDVIKRDKGRCTWVQGEQNGGTWRQWADPRRCTNPGVDVDHIGNPEDHSLDNLRLLCEPHHDHRTALQANAAKKLNAHTRKRKPMPHPGMVTQRRGGG